MPANEALESDIIGDLPKRCDVVGGCEIMTRGVTIGAVRDRNILPGDSAA